MPVPCVLVDRQQERVVSWSVGWCVARGLAVVVILVSSLWHKESIFLLSTLNPDSTAGAYYIHQRVQHNRSTRVSWFCTHLQSPIAGLVLAVCFRVGGRSLSGRGSRCRRRTCGVVAAAGTGSSRGDVAALLAHAYIAVSARQGDLLVGARLGSSPLEDNPFQRRR